MLEAGPDMNPILFYLGLRCAPSTVFALPLTYIRVSFPPHMTISPTPTHPPIPTKHKQTQRRRPLPRAARPVPRPGAARHHQGRRRGRRRYPVAGGG